jgi:hypothetical protein
VEWIACSGVKTPSSWTFPIRLIIRADGVRDPIDHALHGSPTDGYAQHRATKFLDGTSTAALTARQLPIQGTQAQAIVPVAADGIWALTICPHWGQRTWCNTRWRTSGWTLARDRHTITTKGYGFTQQH